MGSDIEGRVYESPGERLARLNDRLDNLGDNISRIYQHLNSSDFSKAPIDRIRGMRSVLKSLLPEIEIVYKEYIDLSGRGHSTYNSVKVKLSRLLDKTEDLIVCKQKHNQVTYWQAQFVSIN